MHLPAGVSGAAISDQRIHFVSWRSNAAGWQDAIMTSRINDQPRDLGPDDTQHLLMAAYARLIELPRPADGTGSTWITKIANWELRLLEVPLPGRADNCSLWVELFDLTVGRGIDSRGCHDLNEARAATDYFLAVARQRHTRL